MLGFAEFSNLNWTVWNNSPPTHLQLHLLLSQPLRAHESPKEARFGLGKASIGSPKAVPVPWVLKGVLNRSERLRVSQAQEESRSACALTFRTDLSEAVSAEKSFFVPEGALRGGASTASA